MKQQSRLVEILTDKRLIISITLSCIVVARYFFPDRFKNFDETSLLLIGMAIVPWVIPMISSLEIPGVLKAEINNVRKTANTALNVAQDSKSKADEAYISSDINTSSTEYLNASERLESLSLEYVKIRSENRKGLHRTSRMTNIFRGMAHTARSLGDKWDIAKEWIKQDDDGKNLSAIAYYYNFPGSADFDSIIECIKKSGQPFIKYWALITLKRKISIEGIDSLSHNNINDLRIISSSTPKNTDRKRLLNIINDTIDGLISK